MLGQVNHRSTEDEAGTHQQHCGNDHQSVGDARVIVQNHAQAVGETRPHHEVRKAEHAADEVHDQRERLRYKRDSAQQHGNDAGDTGDTHEPAEELALLKGGGFDGEEHESALVQGAVQPAEEDGDDSPGERHNGAHKEGAELTVFGDLRISNHVCGAEAEEHTARVERRKNQADQCPDASAEGGEHILPL